MNDTNNLTQVVADLIRDVRYGVETQWPEVAQQALSYDFAEALIGFCVALAFVIASAIVLRIAIRECRDADGYCGGDGWVLLSVVSAIILLTSVLITPVIGSTMVKIKMAPKLYLLDRFIKK